MSTNYIDIIIEYFGSAPRQYTSQNRGWKPAVLPSNIYFDKGPPEMIADSWIQLNG